MPTEHTPTPKFDSERLAKAKYLTVPEAAFYLGYTTDNYTAPNHAFRTMAARHGLRHGYAGRRLVFQRADIDDLVARQDTRRTA